MSVAEITRQIKPLSWREKLALIEEISKMLREENVLTDCFTPDGKYPVFTPYNEEKAASQLQDFIKSQP